MYPLSYELPTVIKLNSVSDAADAKVVSDYLTDKTGLHNFEYQSIDFYLQEIFYQAYLFLKENFGKKLANPQFSIKNNMQNPTIEGWRANLRVAATVTEDVTIGEWVNKIGGYEFAQKEFKKNDRVFVDVFFNYGGYINNSEKITPPKAVSGFAIDQKIRLRNRDIQTQKIPQVALKIKEVSFGTVTNSERKINDKGELIVTA